MEITPEICARIAARQTAIEETYSPLATRNADARRRRPDPRRPEDPLIRPPFYRDADRILHSKGFTRYIDKTQVFFLIDNEHITHRVIHVQLVSKIGRTIGRALGLNEDLIEAIALGHDIGHVPFGHRGEECLDGLCNRHTIGRFFHNVQSVRFLDVIEDCNLTLQVLDGILCHNGEVHHRSLAPAGEVTPEGFEEKFRRLSSGEAEEIPSSTMEGCVVRFADTIAYLGRDLEDAIEVGLIDGDGDDLMAICRESFGIEHPDEINRTVVDTAIRDIINESMGVERISFSGEVSDGIRQLREFSRTHIYESPVLTSQMGKIQTMFATLFEHFLTDLERENTASPIFRDFIEAPWISPDYLQKEGEAGKVRDFVAGMTDRYFEDAFREITIPKRVKNAYR
ncbi:deoxyguanosinetriphosphate triphosphohydrolase family protein [Methanofollis fontis]|uniref:Phosphohydrolase n=1 Tax=Methanofollis fontis TaxID=2052832 RepID=A0A483CRV3_9EURY|nr:HD domain-containing protein [Methanofollis fontis]TAJ45883.1 phosphohydrolase [Methanofollis fontis]